MTTAISDNELFTIYYEDGTRIVSPSFHILLFMNEDFTSIPDEILYVFNEYFKICDRDTMTFFKDENMRKHRKVNKNTFNLLEKWVRNTGVGHKEMIQVEMQDGDNYAGTPNFGVNFWGLEEGEGGHGIDSNMIRLIFPATYGEKDCEQMYMLVCDLASHLPVSSGLVGYNLERSGYHQEPADRGAWRISMKYPGFDIARDTQDTIGVGRDGIKGVNWLTLLSGDFAELVDGVEELSQAVNSGSIRELPNGVVVIRACDRPTVGDDPRKIEPYHNVFSVLEPLVQRILPRFGAFDLPGEDYIEKTQEWILRLADRI